MNTPPAVSIIIPFYNGEKYLVEAIDSVLTQSFKDWELLLSDDGSTDSSQDIAKSYVEKYPDKVKYLAHEGNVNKGRSAIRNLGISNAKGSYIALLDCDDIWLPEKLQEQINIMNTHPEVGMVYGKTQIWFSWSGLSEDEGKDYFNDLGVVANSIIEPHKLVKLQLENKVQSPTTCSVLIRKEVFEEVGYFLDDFQGMFEDLAFFTKVCLQYKVYVSGNIWAKYRQHSESCCAESEKKGNTWQERYPILQWIEAYLIENNVQDKAVWKALNKELFPYRHEKLFLLMNDPKRLFKRFQKRGLSIVKKKFK